MVCHKGNHRLQGGSGESEKNPVFMTVQIGASRFQEIEDL